MIVKVLGSAAGGAFPQWNCACSNCARLRRGGIQAQSRTQSQLAVSPDGRHWHLLNASPDLRSQIEANRELHPDPAQGTRHSPIQSVTLTNADLDHVLGLLLLRESQPLVVNASASVARILLEDNSFFGMLRQSAAQTRFNAIEPGRAFELAGPDGEGSGIRCTPYPVSDRYPRYVQPARVGQLAPQEAVFGLAIEAPGGGGRVGYFPGLPAVTPELERVFVGCRALLVDGTFWDEDELRRVHGSAKGASEMGHLPLSGEKGLLKRLDGVAGLKGVRKILVHINNTNPVLDQSSEAHRLTRAAGWEIAHDGLEIRL